ncbi:hypothetical protein N9L66_00715 [Porticoccaceae bacterium]|nr:hypothetical protein [Porticoccaceae bacterium]MDA8788825.1 hypothetical protein [Porticoccaceae bacterium]MDB2664981.1 hypothetical protein [Porticoccaceae bacterium]
MLAYNNSKSGSNVFSLNRPGLTIAAQISKLKAFYPISAIVCDLKHRHSFCEADKVGKRLIEKVEHECDAIFRLLDLGDEKLENIDWIRGQIAPVVSSLLASLYRDIGNKCFDSDIANTVTPALLADVKMSVPSAWQNAGSRVLMIDSTLNALAEFKSAFKSNNLGFVSKEDACSWARSAIFDAAQHAVLIIQSEVPHGTDGDPVILMRAMIKQSGSALADAWRSASGCWLKNDDDFVKTLDEIKARQIEYMDAAIDIICSMNDDIASSVALGAL